MAINIQTFYGLSQLPFEDDLHSPLFFSGPPQRHALDFIERHKEQDQWLAAIIAEKGVGKTSICRRYLQANSDSSIYIPRPPANIRQLVRHLSSLLGEIEHESNDSKEVFKQIELKWADHPELNRVLLIIDEAQELTAQIMKFFIMWHERAVNRGYRLSILLVGEVAPGSSFEAACKEHDCEQLFMPPLTQMETVAYLKHRLEVSGNKNVFSFDAAKYIFAESKGNIRELNQAGRSALSKGFAAKARFITASHLDVDSEALRKAAAAPLPAMPVKKSGFSLSIALGLVLLLALSSIAYLSIHNGAGRGGEQLTVDFAPLLPTGSVERQVGGRAIALDFTSAPRGQFSDSNINQALSFQMLLALWGVNPGTIHSNYCDFVRLNKLDCLELVSDWDLLQRLSTPAQIKIGFVDGAEVLMTLESIHGDDAYLYYAGDRYVAAVNELKKHWNKRYTVLWRAPWGFKGVIEPGAIDSALPDIRHRFLSWLEHVANFKAEKLTGDDFSNMSSLTYDDNFVSIVKLFQRKNNLEVDGVIRPHVLIILDSRVKALNDKQ
jgi:MSHA biogenesis protein MshM